MKKLRKNVSRETLKNKTEYDVIVIGAGHAGCEAALASARNDAYTKLISINMDGIGIMACNSAIGGPGRGQLIREIDALGGEIGKNADRNYMHMRMLNTSRGPAVRALRANVDKKEYFLSMKHILENQEGLELKQGLVTDISKKNGNYSIITSDGEINETKTVVICSGTFLRGRIYWGRYSLQAGRHGEINSRRMAINLEKMGYKFSRLSTDTPPRVDRKSINFKNLEIQPYDKEPKMFSFGGSFDGREQLDIHITYINKGCIEYIYENLDKSPIFGGDIRSEGPKYCPSIEEKVKRFRKKERHIIFLQPEGRETNEIYLHGLFTTFPEDIQREIIKKIPGLENAEITRPGYGVEYDYLLPNQVKRSLESKKHNNIYFAGQINGTTGYEEAASQGIIAGINAARSSKGLEKITITREDGYIGVLIDDITLKELSEPYRMLTSRNEYRLFHRHDNADSRMAKFLKEMGKEKKYRSVISKYEKISNAIDQMGKSSYFKKINVQNRIKAGKTTENDKKTLLKELNLSDEELDSVYINIRYEDYISREKKRIKKVRDSYNMELPQDIDYTLIKNLSNEARKNLIKIKPGTIEQASRIEGVNPSDLFSIIAGLKNVSRET